MAEDRERDEMVGLLRYANFSKVAEAVGVKRAAVSNWAAGRNVSPKRLEQVRALLGAPVTPQGTTKEPPPEWARAMESRLVEAIEGRLPSDLVMRAYEVIQRLEGRRPPRGEDPPEESDAQDPDGAGPQVQADGLPPVPRDEG